MSELAVTLRSLSLSFGSNSVLRGLDLDVAPGEFVALLGRSGSGKTTLLRVLAGLQTPDAGSASVPQPRAVVFQEPRLLPWKRVWENVALGLPRENAHARAAAALSEVQLEHRADAWPLTLSGGEAQRAGLARALVREPKFLLLDEPFASIDALTRLRMHDLVSALWLAHRPAILLVTHDVDEVRLHRRHAADCGPGLGRRFRLRGIDPAARQEQRDSRPRRCQDQRARRSARQKDRAGQGLERAQRAGASAQESRRRLGLIPKPVSIAQAVWTPGGSLTATEVHK
jgi:sulfonate transport system ATP-binding protein